MPSTTLIRALRVEPLDIPLFEPFGISGGAQAAANNVLVTLELADGTRGYGEAAPLPAYNGETQAQALAVLEGAQLWLVGQEASDWRRLAAEFRGRGGAWCGSAQCAFEMALLDAFLKQRGEPMWKFFGGATTIRHHQSCFELLTRDAHTVVIRQRECQPKRTAARHDCDFVQWVIALHH